MIVSLLQISIISNSLCGLMIHEIRVVQGRVELCSGKQNTLDHSHTLVMEKWPATHSASAQLSVGGIVF